MNRGEHVSVQAASRRCTDGEGEAHLDGKEGTASAGKEAAARAASSASRINRGGTPFATTVCMTFSRVEDVELSAHAPMPSSLERPSSAANLAMPGGTGPSGIG